MNTSYSMKMSTSTKEWKVLIMRRLKVFSLKQRKTSSKDKTHNRNELGMGTSLKHHWYRIIFHIKTISIIMPLLSYFMIIYLTKTTDSQIEPFCNIVVSYMIKLWFKAASDPALWCQKGAEIYQNSMIFVYEYQNHAFRDSIYLTKSPKVTIFSASESGI